VQRTIPQALPTAAYAQYQAIPTIVFTKHRVSGIPNYSLYRHLVSGTSHYSLNIVPVTPNYSCTKYSLPSTPHYSLYRVQTTPSLALPGSLYRIKIPVTLNYSQYRK
jgi:hypothetical protein